MSENAARLVLKTILTKGWIKGAFERNGSKEGEPTERGGVCLVGAMNTLGFQVIDTKFKDALDQSIKDAFPNRGIGHHDFVAFNDAKDTKVEDVILVLEKTAIRLDEVE